MSGRCAEKGCVFPSLDGSPLCRHHCRLFAALRTEPAMDACPSCRSRSVQHGHTRNGNARRQCCLCHKTWTIHRDEKWPLQYSYLPKAKIDKLVACYQRGKTARTAARLCGVADATARTAYRTMRRILGVALCPCGQPSTHQGWCRVRYRQSEKRQAFMKNWHRNVGGSSSGLRRVV